MCLFYYIVVVFVHKGVSFGLDRLNPKRRVLASGGVGGCSHPYREALVHVFLRISSCETDWHQTCPPIDARKGLLILLIPITRHGCPVLLFLVTLAVLTQHSRGSSKLPEIRSVKKKRLCLLTGAFWVFRLRSAQARGTAPKVFRPRSAQARGTAPPWQTAEKIASSTT